MGCAGSKGPLVSERPRFQRPASPMHVSSVGFPALVGAMCALPHWQIGVVGLGGTSILVDSIQTMSCMKAAMHTELSSHSGRNNIFSYTT